MPVDTSKVRTVAVVGHASSGKTSLLDASLFIAKAVDKHGRVANGTSAADCLPRLSPPAASPALSAAIRRRGNAIAAFAANAAAVSATTFGPASIFPAIEQLSAST